MKKKILLVILMVLMVIPFAVKADEEVDAEVDAPKYTNMNLKDTLESEGIKANLKNYKETDDQITIYMFRGQGCSHCQDFLNFLASIVEDYGKYFKLESYEVWYDTTNNELKGEVAKTLGDKEGGVPYIIIGKKSYVGFDETVMGEEMKKLIINGYNEDEKYDVMEHLGEVPDIKNDTNVIVWVSVGIIIVIAAACLIPSGNKKVVAEEKPVEKKEVKEEKPIEEKKEETVKKPNNASKNKSNNKKKTNNKKK